MVKKRGIFIIIILILAILITGVLIAIKSGIKINKESINNKFSNLNISFNKENINYSIIIFSAQWIIIMIIIIVAYFRYIKNKKKEKRKIEYSKKINRKSSSETDFDILYRLLKEEKSLSISTIAAIFKIKKEIALEWAKILESNELGLLEYPAFGEPELILKEEESEEKQKEDKKKAKGDKSKEKNETNKKKEKTSKKKTKLKKKK